jgi:hypothetical protein
MISPQHAGTLPHLLMKVDAVAAQLTALPMKLFWIGAVLVAALILFGQR